MLVPFLSPHGGVLLAEYCLTMECTPNSKFTLRICSLGICVISLSCHFMSLQKLITDQVFNVGTKDTITLCQWEVLNNTRTPCTMYVLHISRPCGCLGVDFQVASKHDMFELPKPQSGRGLQQHVRRRSDQTHPTLGANSWFLAIQKSLPGPFALFFIQSMCETNAYHQRI